LNKEKLIKSRAGKNALHLTHEIQQVNAKKNIKFGFRLRVSGMNLKWQLRHLI